ncbi:MAG: hypothetical protein K0S23_2714 [Fluviicola sp.]|jgi:hypothetical protein|nr:hypothetical protein [Fluviicola sp.]
MEYSSYIPRFSVLTKADQTNDRFGSSETEPQSSSAAADSYPYLNYSL